MGVGDLQDLHEKYKNKGLVVLGINTMDAVESFTQFSDKHRLTFPSILDTSLDAVAAMEKYEILSGKSGVPLTYIIDRDGKIVDGWYGHDRTKAELAIKRLELNDLD